MDRNGPGHGRGLLVRTVLRPIGQYVHFGLPAGPSCDIGRKLSLISMCLMVRGRITNVLWAHTIRAALTRIGTSVRATATNVGTSVRAARTSISASVRGAITRIGPGIRAATIRMGPRVVTAIPIIGGGDNLNSRNLHTAHHTLGTRSHTARRSTHNPGHIRSSRHRPDNRSRIAHHSIRWSRNNRRSRELLQRRPASRFQAQHLIHPIPIRHGRHAIRRHAIRHRANHLPNEHLLRSEGRR